MTDPLTLEHDVEQLLDRELAKRRFETLGIRVERRGIASSGKGESYESEATVDFLDDGGICDVLEFFVYKAGEPVASLDEFANWISAALDDVVGKHRTAE